VVIDRGRSPTAGSSPIQHVDGNVITVLESDPGVSCMAPYVRNHQLAKVAARCMAGQSLASQGITKEVTPPYFSVKEAVFPFGEVLVLNMIPGPES
jgi:carbamoyl-phosphate synthase large subunit